MCGVLAISLKTNKKNDIGKIVDELLSQLSHRGPDDSGKKIIGNSAIGMTRLSIRSNQSDETPHSIRNNFVAYNGEIYQYKNNQNICIPKNSHDEVEAILNEYKLDGMYSYAILNNNEEIRIGRDINGIKPLFCRKIKNGIAVSSELKGLLGLEKVKLNLGAIREFLVYGNLFRFNSFYNGIFELKPGYEGLIVEGKFKGFKKHKLFESTELFSSSLNSIIEKSIHSTLISNHEIGIAFSGGLDSSYIVQTVKANDNQKLPIKLFSLKNVENNDGVSNIDSLTRLKVSNNEFKLFSKVINPQHFIRNTRESVQILSVPHSLTSNALYIELAKLIKKHTELRVLLTGEGADEIFCGYDSYKSLLNKDSMLRKFYVSKKAKYKYFLNINDIQEPSFIKFKDIRSAEKKYSLMPLLNRLDHILMNYQIEGRVPFLHGNIQQFAAMYSFNNLVTKEQTKIPLREEYERVFSSREHKFTKVPFRFNLKQVEEELVSECLTLLNKFSHLYILSGILNNRIIKFIRDRKFSNEDLLFLFRVLTIGYWFEHLENSNIQLEFSN